MHMCFIIFWTIFQLCWLPLLQKVVWEQEQNRAVFFLSIPCSNQSCKQKKHGGAPGSGSAAARLRGLGRGGAAMGGVEGWKGPRLEGVPWWRTLASHLSCEVTILFVFIGFLLNFQFLWFQFPTGQVVRHLNLPSCCQKGTAKLWMVCPSTGRGRAVVSVDSSVWALECSGYCMFFWWGFLSMFPSLLILENGYV